MQQDRKVRQSPQQTAIFRGDLPQEKEQSGMNSIIKILQLKKWFSECVFGHQPPLQPLVLEVALTVAGPFQQSVFCTYLPQ
ncbi:MAG TPA: hypothetical protein VGE06_01805 [Flavisolibacter sp.]